MDEEQLENRRQYDALMRDLFGDEEAQKGLEALRTFVGVALVSDDEHEDIDAAAELVNDLTREELIGVIGIGTSWVARVTDRQYLKSYAEWLAA